MTSRPPSSGGGSGGVGAGGGASPGIAAQPPSKRARHASPDSKSPASHQGRSPQDDQTVTSEPPTSAAGSAKSGQSSSFRNVSACNRCRLRKNRCDQRLPSCLSCEKAGVKCVGYDPITKREIPRSYVFYLETRVKHLEELLRAHNIPFDPADVLDSSSRPPQDVNPLQTPTEEVPSQDMRAPPSVQQTPQGSETQGESDRMNKLVNNASLVGIQGSSDPRHLGSTSGISFARVVFAAVKSSLNSNGSEKGSHKGSVISLPTKAIGPNGGSTTMRDSFFGLQTKPTIKQAPFPEKPLGSKLVNLYFEHANPQIPVLHRGDFMKMFELAYAEGESRVRGPRELYMLNIVFAIGSGIIMDSSDTANADSSSQEPSSTVQCQPEEYHASAIVHLEACLAAAHSVERPDGFGGGLEELQAVLLLAGFALLRPVPPGLWYITGVAVRLAVDLGLYYEDGKDTDIESKLVESNHLSPDSQQTFRNRLDQERGRREYIRDMRRRLWWSTYCVDRLVSTCVGRPFGVTDQVITTEFPSLLEDKYITPTGFLEPPGGPAEASSKIVAYHYLRLRLLQSEILQVLQHQQAQMARASGVNQRNPYMHIHLPSPFLHQFGSFREWRIDIDKRLWHWKTSAPTKRETGVQFSTDFLELNYWQAIIMLYRQSLSVPPVFVGEYNTSDEVESPHANLTNVELREDEERVYLKVAEAGQKVLRLYRKLHRVHLVNYTYLATHHLFMAGISFLYAIWHSPVVRSRLTMDEVDFTILAATSVLGDLIDKCPPAEACRDAFDRMSKATVQMCMSTTGFGSSAGAHGLNTRRTSGNQGYRDPSQDSDYFGNNYSRQPKPQQTAASRPKPQFDMGLNDLYASGATNLKSKSVPRQAANLQRDASTRSGQAVVKSESRNSTQTPDKYVSRSGPGSIATSNSPTNYVSPTDTSAIDPSLLPGGSPQSTTSRQYSQSSPHAMNANPPSGYGANNVYSYPVAPGMDDMQMQGVDLDFLQGNGYSNDAQNGNGTAQPGFDLGMSLGLSWDGMDHDFSDGNQVDLFDGFFFGGASGGGSSGF